MTISWNDLIEDMKKWKEHFVPGIRVVFHGGSGSWAQLQLLSGIVREIDDDPMWPFGVEIERPDLLGSDDFWNEHENRHIAWVSGSMLLDYEKLKPEDRALVNSGQGLIPYVPPDLDVLYPDGVAESVLTKEELGDFFHLSDVRGDREEDVEDMYWMLAQADPARPRSWMRLCQLLITQARPKVLEDAIARAIAAMPRDLSTFRDFHIPIARLLLLAHEGDVTSKLLDDVPAELRPRLGGYKAILGVSLVWRLKLPKEQWKKWYDQLPAAVIDPMRYLRRWAEGAIRTDEKETPEFPTNDG